MTSWKSGSLNLLLKVFFFDEFLLCKVNNEVGSTSNIYIFFQKKNTQKFIFN